MKNRRMMRKVSCIRDNSKQYVMLVEILAIVILFCLQRNVKNYGLMYEYRKKLT